MLDSYWRFSDNMLAENEVFWCSAGGLSFQYKKFQITKHKYQTNHNAQ
jgi:hypothetical protein